jgi:DNA-binding MarR family transcriptional regulator
VNPILKEGIASIQRPVLIPRVLHYLHENYEANPLEIISQGWNRRTIESSLDKMKDLGLVNFTEVSAFPCFEKRFHLTDKGERVMPFLGHLERELGLCLGAEGGCINDMPKWCMPILVQMLRNRDHGVSRIIKQLELSPSQAYRCLRFMEESDILQREGREVGKRVDSVHVFSEKGIHVAIAADALDKALREI